MAHRACAKRHLGLYLLAVCLCLCGLQISLNNTSIATLHMTNMSASSAAQVYAKLLPYVSTHYTQFRSCNQCTQLNFTYKAANYSMCSSTDVFLLILVHSHPKNLEKRNTIRQTWALKSIHKERGIKTVFLLGKSQDGVDAKVERELNTYRDLVLIDFIDEYRWLTNKSMAGFNWAANYCPNAQFILKTDDDCYNNPAKFVDFLTTTWFPDEFVAGKCFAGYPDRRTNSRWHIPTEQFPDKFYPVYCSGQAYLLSRKAVPLIVSASKNVPFFRMEDIYITGFCRENAGISVLQIPGIDVRVDSVSDCDMATWVKNIHKVNSTTARHLWTAANTTCPQTTANTYKLLGLSTFILMWCLVLHFVLKNSYTITVKS